MFNRPGNIGIRWWSVGHMSHLVRAGLGLVSWTQSSLLIGWAQQMVTSVSGVIDVTVRRGSCLRWYRGLLTWWRHHHCTSVQCTVQGLLYSAGHFSLGWSSAPLYCHTVNLVIKQTSPGRLLSTCQDPDCPVSLWAWVKGIFSTSSVKRMKDWWQILLTSGSQVHFSHCQRQRHVLRKYTVCFLSIMQIGSQSRSSW